MKVLRCWMVATCLLGFGLAGGCATDTAIKPTAPAPVVAPVPATKTQTPLDAGKLTVSGKHSHVYDVDEGGVLAVSQDALPDCHCAGRTWWVRSVRGGGGGGPPEHEVRMTIDASGYIAVAEEIDRKEKVEVVYTPARVVIPDKLPVQASGGAAYEQEVRMVVHPLGDRSKVRASGTAHNQIRYVGDEEITTAAGTFTARRLSSTLTAHLGTATSVDSTEQWWVDGIGLVFEQSREVTHALGLKVRDNSATMGLRSFEGVAK